jgi:hypothetical protein
MIRLLDEFVPHLRWRHGYGEIVVRDVASGHPLPESGVLAGWRVQPFVSFSW